MRLHRSRQTLPCARVANTLPSMQRDRTMSPFLPLSSAWLWALAICVAAAVLEGLMSGTGVKTRFAELRLPKMALPLWAWALVGLAYYLLFFLLLEALLAKPAVPGLTVPALALIGILLVANAGWNWIFFRKRDLRVSFLFFIPYLLLALTLAVLLAAMQHPLANAYLVYMAYLGYATWWGWQVWRLNMPTNHQ